MISATILTALAYATPIPTPRQPDITTMVTKAQKDARCRADQTRVASIVGNCLKAESAWFKRPGTNAECLKVTGGQINEAYASCRKELIEDLVVIGSELNHTYHPPTQ